MSHPQSILIRGGTIIDPASGMHAVGDVAIAGEIITAVGQAPEHFVPDLTVDASGCLVMPGLVDLCARLGEPGGEAAGLLDSELAAAAAGGVTRVVCPPDTDPVLDEPSLVEMLRWRARRIKRSRVYPLGALTVGLKGERLAEMASLVKASCIGLSQADTPVADTQLLYRALQYASTFGYKVWLRPLDAHLGRGVAASGAYAQRLGLAGVPTMAETIALHTLFELVRATGCAVHVSKMSSAAGVELVRRAKAEGLPVTADVSMHNILLTDLDIGYFDARMRLDPPLRQEADRIALLGGLADGTIDALCSDHTPVGSDDKILPFAEAAPGASGLELLLPAVLEFARQSGLALPRALTVATSRAAAAAGLAPLQLRAGAAAELIVVDPEARWSATPEQLGSRIKNTPLAGLELSGRVRATIIDGRVIYQRADGASPADLARAEVSRNPQAPGIGTAP
ncbi:MAG: dihydroorotase [Thiomonas delicata]|uniref:Dihydroorotase-like protein n=1 Tax=Thiomonas delicata TaxID=364030 RepID=A0A238D622_THIDL|nr:dihydroorotase [Thiomonas delicata]SBP88681.1 Dihydroorotase-like protein [Thiomonas delicata]